jgi:hypothetical protein
MIKQLGPQPRLVRKMFFLILGKRVFRPEHYFESPTSTLSNQFMIFFLLFFFLVRAKVNFFEAICTVNDKPIKRNQEMILRMLWWSEEDRKRVFLEIDAVPAAVVVKLNQQVRRIRLIKPAGERKTVKPR